MIAIAEAAFISSHMGSTILFSHGSDCSLRCFCVTISDFFSTIFAIMRAYRKNSSAVLINEKTIDEAIMSTLIDYGFNHIAHKDHTFQNRAPCRTWTNDLLITSELLYQLSQRGLIGLLPGAHKVDTPDFHNILLGTQPQKPNTTTLKTGQKGLPISLPSWLTSFFVTDGLWFLRVTGEVRTHAWWSHNPLP